jgi:hypothetical protein
VRLARTAARMSDVEDLCNRAWDLLDEADDSVLSRRIEAQIVATLALVAEMRLLRDELIKKAKG